MTDAELLGEVEDVIRTMPAAYQLTHDSPDILEWFGRAAAVMHTVSPPMGAGFNHAIDKLHRHGHSSAGARDVQRLLHQARYALRMQTVGPVSLAVGTGASFDYFDEVRKIIETAAADLFFVDPYLDAEFVSRYLPHVKGGVAVRLLTSKRAAQLVPAVEAFVGQTGLSVQVRSSAEMHDRFVIVDGTSIYQSGASFKDGAKRAPTTLSQITDAFAEVKKQYEDRWSAASVHL